MERGLERTVSNKRFAFHGWIGLALIAIFWTLNWKLEGPRTHWGFFPLWLGYCLTIDALVLYRTGSSLLTRSWRKYVGLFLVSAPAWWIFEFFNARLGNWNYVGAEYFTKIEFFAWATLNFTVVIPAVFGTTELFTSLEWIKKGKRGLVITGKPRTTICFFVLGWALLAIMMIRPRLFFPFLWLSVFFILEPINIWLGNRSLVTWLKHGDWRPIIALWLGVLTTGFFWEMWNYFSYPKWVYIIPWGDWFKVFEMPILGYGGYLPFSLELFSLYHLVTGIFGEKRSDYVRIVAEN